jgi:hypothetical protein
MEGFLKKLIRLFIAIFCIFFVLQAMPGSFLPFMRTLLDRSAQAVSDMTLLLAGKIDEISGEGHDTQDGPTGGSGAEKKGDSADGEDLEDDSHRSGDGSGSGDAGSQAAESGPADDDAEEDSTDAAPADDGSGAGEDSSADQTADPPAEDSSRAALTDEDIEYFYYTKISREERLLYDAMLALAQSPEAGQGAEESRLLSLNPSSEEFAQSYTRAYNALTSDHPELFWIAQGRAKYECRYYLLPSLGGQYRIMLSLTAGDSSDSESGGDQTALFESFHEEEKELDEAARALLDQVDLSLSDAAIALQLHDLLIDTAWYNIEAGADDYAHTAYGALVEDSAGNPGGALCDGYALAYEYLLQRAGVTSTMVCGYAGSSEEDTEKHAWNLVQLDGDWYEVDATWDDLDFLLSPDEEGYDLLAEALSDEDYMRRIRHYMFNRTTDQMRSFTPGDEYTYSSYNGWVTLLQPSVHIRFSADESEQTRDYVTPLAPVAEGTWYSWETLEGM